MSYCFCLIGVSFVPPAGIEPAMQDSESRGLSVSLRGRVAEGTGFEPVPLLRENGFRNRRF